MLNFYLNIPTKILFGKNEEQNIGKLIKPYATSVLIHYGSDRIEKNGLLQTVINSLVNENIPYLLLSGVVPNPRIDKVYEGIKLCKENNIDHIIAIGGGSVIDSAKAIALGAVIESDVWDYYFIKRNKANKSLKVSTILTIPAAGSEGSNSTVITNLVEMRKIGYNSDQVRPFLSIINPTFFYTLKEHDFSSGVFDMMSHIFERYFTNTMNNDLTDSLCESTLKAIIKHAKIVYDMLYSKKTIVDENILYDSMSQLALSSTIAHNGILGIGREQDWACHQIEHDLSAMFDITHGLGLAIITPAWMKYVYATNKDIFLKFAINVMEVKLNNKNPDLTIMQAIVRLKKFCKYIGLFTKLSQIKIDYNILSTLANNACKDFNLGTRTIGGLKKLNANDVLEILKFAY